MRAFVITGPQESVVTEVAAPVAAPGQAVIDVQRAGVCGTDVELFTGEMAYFRQGHTQYPVRPGHEWYGTVSAVGDGVDPAWLGVPVTGDTMLGCGQCRRCRGGLHHVCEQRQEVGIRGGWAGALAEQLAMPVTALRALPPGLDAQAGAMVEPAGSALRAVRAAGLSPGDRVLVLGPGTIGLLTAMFALAQGAEVHVLGETPESLQLARSLGASGAWRAGQLPPLPLDAVIDCSTAADLPALAIELVEPGKRVVCVGLAGHPSLADTRALVLKDVTVTGILGASAGLDGAAEQFASGAVDPRPLIAATVGLGEVGAVLAGTRPPGAGPGPKVQVDPRLP
jgi:threonine dehydrogenase-like Zn-dependent dehydrogenase